MYDIVYDTFLSHEIRSSPLFTYIFFERFWNTCSIIKKYSLLNSLAATNQDMGKKSLRQKGYGDPHFFLAKRWIYENRKMEIVKIIRKKGLERWKKRRSNESICLRIMTSYPLLCLRFGSPSERKCQISKSDRWKFRFFSVFIRTFAQREFVWPNSDRSKSHRTNDSIGDVRIPQYWSLDFNLVWDSVYDAPDKLICGF